MQKITSSREHRVASHRRAFEDALLPSYTGGFPRWIRDDGESGYERACHFRNTYPIQIKFIPTKISGDLHLAREYTYVPFMIFTAKESYYVKDYKDYLATRNLI